MKIMPRKSFLYIIMFFSVVLMTIIMMKPWLLLTIPIWFGIDIILSAVFINRFASYKGTTFLKQCVVQLLILDNELGYVWTCLKKKKPSYINKDVVYFDGQMDGIQDTSSIMAWCSMLSLTILMCIVFIMMFI